MEKQREQPRQSIQRRGADSISAPGNRFPPDGEIAADRGSIGNGCKLRLARGAGSGDEIGRIGQRREGPWRACRGKDGSQPNGSFGLRGGIAERQGGEELVQKEEGTSQCAESLAKSSVAPEGGFLGRAHEGHGNKASQQRAPERRSEIEDVFNEDDDGIAGHRARRRQRRRGMPRLLPQPEIGARPVAAAFAVAADQAARLGGDAAADPLDDAARLFLFQNQVCAARKGRRPRRSRKGGHQFACM